MSFRRLPGRRSTATSCVAFAAALFWTHAHAASPRFHEFVPRVPPAASAASALGALHAAQQIDALQADKAARTPVERKIDSKVLYTLRMLAGRPVAPGVDTLLTGVQVDDADHLLLDVVANVTDALVARVVAAGGEILLENRRLRSLRVVLPASAVDGLAASPDVIAIWPKRDGGGGSGRGSIETQGNATHLAAAARGTFLGEGAGLEIGVLSDGVLHLAQSQASGDLPPACGTPPCITVLPGQEGTGDEGTAMLEIVHDMAPKATLYFATAAGSLESFAQNIHDLRAAGCDFIIDDYKYFVETPFQDGQAPAVLSTSNGGLLTQAVNDAVADGASYFSHAGNEGALDRGTSGTYESDFHGVPSPGAPLPATGQVHDFGGGATDDAITAVGFQDFYFAGLWWADPLGASANDYDLYLLDPTGTFVVASSTNVQSGTQDPVEFFDGPGIIVPGRRLVVHQQAGAADRFFHLGVLRHGLAVATQGAVYGHSAASGAYSVAAAPAAGASPDFGEPVGPFPGAFDGTSRIELFSADGPRKIFFEADSSPITPGNFSATGGRVLAKPDVTAADGVAVTGVGFRTPFFGTSAAAPSAAGVAAIVESAAPSLSATELRDALTATAIDVEGPGFDRNSGFGIIMPFAALASLGARQYAAPEVASAVATENPGDGDGDLEAGEGVKLAVTLANVSPTVAATEVFATLTTSTPGIALTEPVTVGHPDLPPGVTADAPLEFTFTITGAAPCPLAIDLTLQVEAATSPPRTLAIHLDGGTLSFPHTFGSSAATIPGLTASAGTQTGRLVVDGATGTCERPKAFPGIVGTGSFARESYAFQACQSGCMPVQFFTLGPPGVFLDAIHGAPFDPASPGTRWITDSGSESPQTCSFPAVAGSSYVLNVNEIAAGGGAGTGYVVQLPKCLVECGTNERPVPLAHDVTVSASSPGGTASASIDDGSFDPDGDAITLTQAPPGPYAAGITSVRLTVVDTRGATAQATASVTVLDVAEPPPTSTPAPEATTPAPSPTLVGGATPTPTPGTASTLDFVTGPGDGARPVRLFDVRGRGAVLTSQLLPFPPGFRAGTFVAASQGRLAAGAGAGDPPRVALFDVTVPESPRFLGSFLPYPRELAAGVHVALGDVDGDGRIDLVTAPGGGRGAVRLFDLANPARPRPIRSFFPYGASFAGGAFVAVADLDADGRADVVTGAGAGAPPHVRAFSGADGSELASFLAYDPAFPGGVAVAAGDVAGTPRAEIVTIPGPGRPAEVRVFRRVPGGAISPVASFLAYTPSIASGAFVATADLDGTAPFELLTSPRPPAAAHVRAFRLGPTGATAIPPSFFAYAPALGSGATISGAR